MAQPIPVGTVLGNRYEITAQTITTAESDMILDGIDQVLNRKVSIVVASAARASLLENNSRILAERSRFNIQILDMGITPEGNKYLITSHTRPDVLLDTLLTDNQALAEEQNDGAIDSEIFGAPKDATKNTYERVGTSTAQAPVAISATKEWTEAAPINPEVISAVSESSGIYEDEDEEETRSRGVWAIALAGVLVLVIGVGAALSSLSSLGNNAPVLADPTAKAASASASAAAASAAASPSATPSPTPAAPPKIAGVTRLIPNNPTYMADMDTMLPYLTDGNANTAWMSYGFGTENFSGLVTGVGLAIKLQTPTLTNTVTIDQIGGTGGAFTVYTNSKDSLDGAVEVAKGTISGPSTAVKLDTAKQADKTGYVIIVFNSASRQSQPIARMPYGLRISELKVA